MTSRDVPRVGIGCVVMRAGRTLLVKSRRSGRWSTPGGNLDLGESPIECARRETAEETGIGVQRLRFMAITNDVMPERRTHYVTLWFRGEAMDDEIRIADDREISEAGWFDLDSLPEPMHPYFTNLVEGRHLPPDTDNPFRRQAVDGDDHRGGSAIEADDR